MRRDRPRMPDGYGVPEGTDGLLKWSQVEERLVAAQQYWMATTRPDGRPHVVPRWGVWVENKLFYDGSPETVHARNSAADGRCVLHLESGWEVVIIEGETRRAVPPGPDLGARISTAFGKYHERGYAPEPDAWEGEGAGGLMVFQPHKAMAWFTFPEDVTRFTFESEE